MPKPTSASDTTPQYSLEELHRIDQSNVDGFLFWHAFLRWHRIVNDELRPFDITFVQLLILNLAWVAERDLGRPPSQREIADEAGTDTMRTSNLITGLADRGLLKRRVDAADKRIRRVKITAKGTALLERASTVAFVTNENFFAQAAEFTGFRSALRVLADLESDDGAQGPPPRISSIP